MEYRSISGHTPEILVVCSVWILEYLLRSLLLANPPGPSSWKHQLLMTYSVFLDGHCPLSAGTAWSKVMLPSRMDDADTKVQPHCLYLGQLWRAVPAPQLSVESAEASDAAKLRASVSLSRVLTSYQCVSPHLFPMNMCPAPNFTCQSLF